MAETDKNLKEAFAGESQANQKYLAFARKAEEEGHPQAARLFRAAAAAETVHAQNHAEAMKLVGTTLENLKQAAEGEAEEFRSMYPAFIEAARREGQEDAEETFDYASQVEEIHHRLYSAAISALQKEEEMPEKELFVCRGCGNTVEDEAPERCPVCGAPRSWFMIIE